MSKMQKRIEFKDIKRNDFIKVTFMLCNIRHFVILKIIKLKENYIRGECIFSTTDEGMVGNKYEFSIFNKIYFSQFFPRCYLKLQKLSVAEVMIYRL